MKVGKLIKLTLAIVLAIVMGVFAFWIWNPTLSLQRWCSHATNVLRASRDHAPDGMSSDRWKAIISWTDKAIGNCLCHPSYITDWQRMKQFRKESRERLRAPVTPETISWFWDGVEAVSYNGKDYAERYRPYPYYFDIEHSAGPVSAKDAANYIGELPATASNVQYVTSEIRPDLGYLLVYRFDASEADCVAYAVAMVERRNKHQPKERCVPFALSPLPAGSFVALPPYAPYGLERQEWFDVDAVAEGYWGPLSQETNGFFVIDTGRGRFYHWMAW
jgi:hypothetical protein